MHLDLISTYLILFYTGQFIHTHPFHQSTKTRQPCRGVCKVFSQATTNLFSAANVSSSSVVTSVSSSLVLVVCSVSSKLIDFQAVSVSNPLCNLVISSVRLPYCSRNFLPLQLCLAMEFLPSIHDACFVLFLGAKLSLVHHRHTDL